MCEWVSVKNQLPVDEGIYVCWMRFKGVVMCSYKAHAGEKIRWWYINEEEQAKRITHWLDLKDP